MFTRLQAKPRREIDHNDPRSRSYHVGYLEGGNDTKANAMTAFKAYLRAKGVDFEPSSLLYELEALLYQEQKRLEDQIKADAQLRIPD